MYDCACYSSLIKCINVSFGYSNNITKVSTILVNSCSLVQFFHPGLISKIIMLFFKNSYIKKYWCSNKVFFLTFIIFYQVLSGKFTHSIHNMAYVAYGSKRSSCRAFFFKKSELLHFAGL